MRLPLLPIILFTLLAQALPVTRLASTPQVKSTNPAAKGLSPTPPSSANAAQRAVIIVGFPGIGKSEITRNALKYSNLKVYDEPGFQGSKNKEAFQTFLEGVRKLATENAVILLAAHPDIGKFLIANNLHFVSVTPGIGLKKEYIGRYLAREKANAAAYKLSGIADKLWDQWIAGMQYNSPLCLQFRDLTAGEHLADVFPEILAKAQSALGGGGTEKGKSAGKAGKMVGGKAGAQSTVKAGGQGVVQNKAKGKHGKA